MCFFKILRIILSIPPCENPKQEAFLDREDDQLGSFPSGGIGIDLNTRLCSVEQENRESESFASDSSAVEVDAVGEKTVKVSEHTNGEVKNFEDKDDHKETKFGERGFENEGVEEAERSRNENEECDRGGKETVPFVGNTNENQNCLDLLIEAAELISGNSTEQYSDSEEPSRDCGLSNELRTRRTSRLELNDLNKKRNHSWTVVNLYNQSDDTSPVVKSKRGRSQALPYRFRDSVVEPLKRSSRPQRPSSTTASGKRLMGS